MATSIVNPGQTSIPGMDSIDQAFGKIYNMFGGSSSSGATSGNQTNLFGTPISGGGSGTGGYTPLTGPENSLTGAWYNLANIAGAAAPTCGPLPASIACAACHDGPECGSSASP